VTANGELAGEPAPRPSDGGKTRGKFWWVKWVAGIALLALLYIVDILAFWLLIPDRRGAELT